MGLELNDLHIGGMFSGRLKWGGGALVVTDVDLMTPLSRKYLSPSTSASLAGCPARWALERIIPSPPDPFKPSDMGTAIHKVFEDLYSLPTGERSFETAWKMAESAAAEVPEQEAWLKAVRPMIEGLWKIETPDRVVVVEREMKVRSEVAGVPFYGLIDRLDEEAGGTVVVDYKTGKLHRGGQYDTHGDQLRLYVAALRHIGIEPSVARLHYVAHGETVRVDLAKRKIDKTTRQFVKSWTTLQRIIETHELPCVASPLCGWCPAVAVCPTAAASRWSKPATPEAEGAGEWLSIDGHPAQSRVTKRTPSTKEKDPMTQFCDDKPWVEIDDSGRINLGSYAAQAAFGTAALALEVLTKAELPATHESIRAMALLLSRTADQVALRLGVNSDIQSSTHTRIRGAVRAALDVTPAPSRDAALDSKVWGIWMKKVAQRAFVVASVAVELLDPPNDGVDIKEFSTDDVASVFRPAVGAGQ